MTRDKEPSERGPVSEESGSSPISPHGLAEHLRNSSIIAKGAGLAVVGGLVTSTITFISMEMTGVGDPESRVYGGLAVALATILFVHLGVMRSRYRRLFHH